MIGRRGFLATLGLSVGLAVSRAIPVLDGLATQALQKPKMLMSMTWMLMSPKNIAGIGRNTLTGTASIARMAMADVPIDTSHEELKEIVAASMRANCITLTDDWEKDFCVSYLTRDETGLHMHRPGAMVVDQ